MPAFKPQQRRLTIQGRVFHFVSYEGHAANPKREQPASPAMWYLMVEGRRCPVIPYDADMPLADVDAALGAWAKGNALAPRKPPSRTPATRRTRTATRHHRNWWGPN